MARLLLKAGLTAGAALAALLLSGCFWTMPGQGPNRQADNAFEGEISVDTVASLDRIWASPLDGGAATDPVTSIHGVHVSTRGSVYGLNGISGERLWTYTPPAPLSVTQPWVRAEQVLVGRWDRTAPVAPGVDGRDVTVALDAETGADHGTAGDGVIAGLRDYNALLWDLEYFPTRFGAYWGATLRVRNLESGATVCCSGRFNLYDGSAAPPDPAPLTLGADQIFNAGVGLNSESTVGNGVRGFELSNEQICMALYTCPSWALATDGATGTPPVLSDDANTVFAGTDSGTVYAVDPDTATTRWSTPVGSAVTDSPALAGGSLFVPTASGDLVVLDAATGARRWSGTTGSRITQQPAVAGDVVFTGSTDGSVKAFNAGGCGTASCSALWTYSTGSSITGAPAVNAGHLYVGTADGRLVAFGL